MTVRYLIFLSIIVTGLSSCTGNGNPGNEKEEKQADSLKTKVLDKATDKFKDSIVPDKKTKQPEN